jgi:hypothetical protein
LPFLINQLQANGELTHTGRTQVVRATGFVL